MNLAFFGNYYAKHDFTVGKYFKVAVVGKKVRNRHGIKFMGREAQWNLEFGIKLEVQLAVDKITYSQPITNHTSIHWSGKGVNAE